MNFRENLSMHTKKLVGVLCVLSMFGLIVLLSPKIPSSLANRGTESSKDQPHAVKKAVAAQPQGIQLPSTQAKSDVPPKIKIVKRSTSVAPNAAPANDNCANAIPIAAFPFNNIQDTTMATDEAGEPGSTCTAQGKSVWYSYSPGANTAVVTVDTCASSPVDTAIMVWQETAGACNFAGFVAVACNDDACGDGFQSMVTFTANPGQTYKIQVGGFNGDSGMITTHVDGTIIICPNVVINGTLGSNSAGFPGPKTSGQQIGRLNRNGIASTCAAPKACLIFDPANMRAFDAYTLTNNSGATACVMVNLNVAPSPTANLQSNAYLGSYDPNNICTNYLADPGLSSGAPQTPTNFSFNVAAGASFVIVVHTTNTPSPVDVGSTYTLTIVGNICAPVVGGCANPSTTIVSADTVNNRVQRFDGTNWAAMMNLGSTPGLVKSPFSAAQTSDGVTIYVADTGNNRVQKSVNSGVAWMVLAPVINLQPNGFNAPKGVAVIPNNPMLVYVADTGNNRILKSIDGGATFTVFAGFGTGLNQVRAPEGLAIACNGDLFVADTGNNRILKFAGPTPMPGTPGVVVAGFGSAPNSVNGPKAVAVDTNGDVYVADTLNNRVMQYPAGNAAAAVLVAGPGSALGQTKFPGGVAVFGAPKPARPGGVEPLVAAAPVSHIVISDTGNNRIEQSANTTGPLFGGFTNVTGAMPGQTGGFGSQTGQFRSPGQIR